MALSSRARGSQAEDEAVRYLQRNGFSLVERNFYCPYGEIDIVVFKGEGLVFVEVKSISSRSGYAWEETLTPRKCKRLEASIFCWLEKNPEYDAMKIQLDFVAILWTNTKEFSIEHLSNI